MSVTMATNRGKQFEEQIRKSFERVDNVSIDRLIDPPAGYKGLRNPSDFIVYKEPIECYIECKAHQGNTLPFTNITQWDRLLEKSKINGVCAGVMIWFIDHDKTIFVPIQVLQSMKELGFKSVNVTKLNQYYILDNYLNINGSKKKVLFEYDLRNFFFDIGYELGEYVYD